MDELIHTRGQNDSIFEASRTVLEALLGAIFPGDDLLGFPPLLIDDLADSTELEKELIDNLVNEIRSELGTTTREGNQDVTQDQIVLLLKSNPAFLATNHAEVLNILLLRLYQKPEVRKVLGFPDQSLYPNGNRLSQGDLSLLEEVIDSYHMGNRF